MGSGCHTVYTGPYCSFRLVMYLCMLCMGSWKDEIIDQSHLKQISDDGPWARSRRVLADVCVKFDQVNSQCHRERGDDGEHLDPTRCSTVVTAATYIWKWAQTSPTPSSTSVLIRDDKEKRENSEATRQHAGSLSVQSLSFVFL